MKKVRSNTLNYGAPKTKILRISSLTDINDHDFVKKQKVNGLCQNYSTILLVNSLNEKLANTESELNLKNDICQKLLSCNEQLKRELIDLTASLFEEANKMVQDANVEKHIIKRQLTESLSKIEVLEAEVEALKLLVLHSTPQMDKNMNFTHLQSPPEFNLRNSDCSISPFYERPPQKDHKAHKRSTSVIEEKKGLFSFGITNMQKNPVITNGCAEWSKANSLPDKCVLHSPYQKTNIRKKCSEYTNSHNFQEAIDTLSTSYSNQTLDGWKNYEIDPIYYEEFIAWHKLITSEIPNPLGKESKFKYADVPFVKRLYQQDILPTLEFKNNKLSELLLNALEENSLAIESSPNPDDASTPKLCVLSQTTKACPYKIKFEDSGLSYDIDQNSRNRIASVGDMLSYVRYIEKGLLNKTDEKEIYWEIMNLKKQMVLARYSFL